MSTDISVDITHSKQDPISVGKGGALSNGALFASLTKGVGARSTGLGSKGGSVLRALNFHLCGPGSNPLAILLVCTV